MRMPRQLGGMRWRTETRAMIRLEPSGYTMPARGSTRSPCFTLNHWSVDVDSACIACADFRYGSARNGVDDSSHDRPWSSFEVRRLLIYREPQCHHYGVQSTASPRSRFWIHHLRSTDDPERVLVICSAHGSLSHLLCESSASISFACTETLMTPRSFSRSTSYFTAQWHG